MADLEKVEPILGAAASSIKAEEMLKKFDAESRYRKYTGFWAKAVSVIAIGMSLFHLYTAGFGTLMAMKQRGIHLAFLMALAFLLYPATSKSPKDRPTIWDLGWLVLGTAGTFYLVLFFEAWCYHYYCSSGSCSPDGW